MRVCCPHFRISCLNSITRRPCRGQIIIVFLLFLLFLQRQFFIQQPNPFLQFFHRRQLFLNFLNLNIVIRCHPKARRQITRGKLFLLLHQSGGVLYFFCFQQLEFLHQALCYPLYVLLIHVHIMYLYHHWFVHIYIFILCKSFSFRALRYKIFF